MVVLGKTQMAPKLSHLLGREDIHPPFCVSGYHIGILDLPAPPRSSEALLPLLLEWCQRRSSGESGLSSLPSGKKPLTLPMMLVENTMNIKFIYINDNLDEWTNSSTKQYKNPITTIHPM